MTASLLTATIVLSLFLPASTNEQDARLHAYRTAWLAASTQAERDSIRTLVLQDISDATIDHAHGQEQAALWDECCDLWDVTPLATPQQAPYIQDMPDVQMRTAGGVDFIEGTTGFSASRDSFFLYSNRYPGYGGLDVYFKANVYFGNLGGYRWISARNLGKGLNTAQDEYGFELRDGQYRFVRVVDGVPTWFRAESRQLVEYLHVRYTCPLTTYVIANINGCRGYLLSSLTLDHDHPVEVPPGAHEIAIRCCAGAPVRVFERCNVTERSLLLFDTDVRVHQCAVAGPITGAAPEDRFGFSVYETAASAEQAMRFLQQQISSTLGPHVVVRISQIPGHLDASISDLVAVVEATGARVERSKATTSRTEITLAANR